MSLEDIVNLLVSKHNLQRIRTGRIKDITSKQTAILIETHIKQENHQMAVTYPEVMIHRSCLTSANNAGLVHGLVDFI